jgi:hypothetical protein
MADYSDPEAYTVSIICALTVKQVAARSFLDKNHPRLKSQPASDNNNYTLGQISEHNCRPWGLPHGPVLFAPGSTACLLSRTSPLGLVRAPFST